MFSKYLNSVKDNVAEISADELADKLKEKNESIHLLDVRETYEWNEEHIPNAIYIGRGCLERDVESIVPDPYDQVIVYCASGKRSALAADTLQKMGYKNVFSLDNGISGWKEQGKLVNVNMRMYSPLTKDYQ